MTAGAVSTGRGQARLRLRVDFVTSVLPAHGAVLRRPLTKLRRSRTRAWPQPLGQPLHPIAGRLPTPEELKRFLADPSTGKRELWIDSLLDSADYAELFANKWAALLRNKRNDAKYTHAA